MASNTISFLFTHFITNLRVEMRYLCFWGSLTSGSSFRQCPECFPQGVLTSNSYTWIKDRFLLTFVVRVFDRGWRPSWIISSFRGLGRVKKFEGFRIFRSHAENLEFTDVEKMTEKITAPGIIQNGRRPRSKTRTTKVSKSSIFFPCLLIWGGGGAPVQVREQ